MVDLTCGGQFAFESVFHGQVKLLRASVYSNIPIGPPDHAYSWMSSQEVAAKWNEEGLHFRTSWADRTARVILGNGVWRSAAKAAGLDRVTWHQTAYIHASVMHDVGVPAKIGSSRWARFCRDHAEPFTIRQGGGTRLKRVKFHDPACLRIGMLGGHFEKNPAAKGRRRG